MAGTRRPLTNDDLRGLVTKQLDDGDELVMTPGANASPEAHEAGERFRATRSDDGRSANQDSREATMRPVSWRPSSILPDIPEQPGWSFRWVRLSVRGEADDMNINQAFRDGYTVASTEDIGNLALASDRSTRFPGGIEIGGLLLCKIPQEVREARERYYAEQALSQVRGVENDMLRENDPRMPVIRPSVQSRTSFGSNQPR